MSVCNSFKRCLFYLALCTFNKNYYRHKVTWFYRTLASFLTRVTNSLTLSLLIIFTAPLGGGNSYFVSFTPPSAATASTTFRGFVLADIIPLMLGIFHSAIGS